VDAAGLLRRRNTFVQEAVTDYRAEARNSRTPTRIRKSRRAGRARGLTTLVRPYAPSTGGKMGAKKLIMAFSLVFLPQFFCQPS